MHSLYPKVTIAALLLCAALAAAFGGEQKGQDEAQSPATAPPDSSFVVDPRDGKRYRTVKIGRQVWMAYNLNYKTGKSWCYDDDIANCKKYGRLYDWNTAMKACPEGWRLPSTPEWNGLSTAIRGYDTKLRSKVGWVGNSNGSDAYGFSALPGGCPKCGCGVGECAAWWTSTEKGYDLALYIYTYFDEDELLGNDIGKGAGFSVRCLKP